MADVTERIEGLRTDIQEATDGAARSDDRIGKVSEQADALAFAAGVGAGHAARA